MHARWFVKHDDALRIAFGTRLKAMRRAQKEWAALVDIRFQQVDRYESGINTYPVEVLVERVDALIVKQRTASAPTLLDGAA